MSSPQGLKRAVAGGYVPPMRRDSCRNCKHGELRFESAQAKHQRKRIYCKVFTTDLNVGGICPYYEKT